MLIVLVLFYWCTCLSHSSQSSQFIFCWNFLYNFWHYFVSFTVYLLSFRSRVHSNSISVIIYLSTYCSTSFLACLISISRYYFTVSLLLFAFLSKERCFLPCILLLYIEWIWTNYCKLSRNFVRATTINCRVSFIDLYLVFPRNFRMVFLPHANTVILLEPYCDTITEPGLPVRYAETLAL